MVRVMLPPSQRVEVEGLRRDTTLTPAERDRVEMVLLSAAGWSAPAVAAHLGYHPATVRAVLVRFGEGSAAALRRKPPGPPPDRARRERVEAALGRLLDRDRTWTSGHLAAALAEEGIALSGRQTRRYLRGMGAGWRRTVRTLRHKQDPAKAERAKRVLASLKKRPATAASASSTSTSAASPPANP
jgi:putative transposase